MLQELTSLQTETLVLLTAVILALINASVAALRSGSFIKQGRQAMMQQDYASAIHYFSQEILNHPEKPKAYQERAEAYRLSGEIDKGLEDKRIANDLITRSNQASSRQKSDQTLSTSLG